MKQVSTQRIIGLVGAKGCGKTMIAKTMEAHYGWKRVRFADGIKRMLSALGLTQEQLDGGDKEIPAPELCGATPRWALQSLGTEWGRNLIHGDLWTHALFRYIERMAWQRAFDCIVIDDVRFPNEVQEIRERGGEIWVVRRPNVEMPTTWLDRLVGSFPSLYRYLRYVTTVQHPSEIYWWDFEADRVLDNSGSLDDVLSQLDTTLTVGGQYVRAS